MCRHRRLNPAGPCWITWWGGLHTAALLSSPASAPCAPRRRSTTCTPRAWSTVSCRRSCGAPREAGPAASAAAVAADGRPCRVASPPRRAVGHPALRLLPSDGPPLPRSAPTAVDIKSSNVLLTASGTAKLADVAFSRKLEHTFLSGAPRRAALRAAPRSAAHAVHAVLRCALFARLRRPRRCVAASKRDERCGRAAPAAPRHPTTDVPTRCLPCVPPDLPLVGTFAWIAPEVLLGGRQCSQAVDIYS